MDKKERRLSLMLCWCIDRISKECGICPLNPDKCLPMRRCDRDGYANDSLCAPSIKRYLERRAREEIF